jgi:hypothetical protein
MKALSVSILSLFTILLYCVSSLPIASQTVPSIADEEARVLSLEAAWNHAEQQKDTQALNLLLADTLSYVDYDGTLMNKPQFLSTARGRSGHTFINKAPWLRLSIARRGPIRRNLTSVAGVSPILGSSRGTRGSAWPVSQR